MAVTNWSEVQEERVEPQFCEARGKFIRGKEIEVGQISYPAGREVKAHAIFSLAKEQFQTAKGFVGEWFPQAALIWSLRAL